MRWQWPRTARAERAVRYTVAGLLAAVPGIWAILTDDARLGLVAAAIPLGWDDPAAGTGTVAAPNDRLSARGGLEGLSLFSICPCFPSVFHLESESEVRSQ